MKHKLFATAAAMLLASFGLSAQEASGFDKFLKQIWFPTEFGLSAPSQEGMSGGLVTRISIEWRQEPQIGLCASAQLDTRFESYDGIVPVGSNLSNADVQFDDFYLGAGYRFKLSDSFCIAAMLHAGATSCSYQTINTTIASGDIQVIGGSQPIPAYYEFGRRSTLVPTVKLTSFFEYYIAPDFCVFLTAGYLQHLQKTPFSLTSAKDGAAVFSLGFTAAIF